MTDTPHSGRRTTDPGLLANTVRRVVNGFSSVWLGIFWASLLFVYCSIGSAMPAVRQLPALEMTEFEWFHWWPFNALMILLCANLIVATIRRIPLRWVNAGVWTIHAGIIMLCVGSYYYFGTKVEGDAPVFRRRVTIGLPGMEQRVYLPALPGNQTSLDAGPNRWRFQVQSTNSAWPILSGEDAGKKAFSVNVMVTPPTGDPFIRQLLAGYPQYTEDIIPGKGRAIKSTGKKLIAEDLDLTLDYEPQEYFHVMDTWALYTRRIGASEWTQRPIHGMPRYHDRIPSRDLVFTQPGDRVPIRAMDLNVPPPTGGDALGDTQVHVTGYLRYARLQQRWKDGGDRLNPVLRASVISSQAAPRSIELSAFDSRLSESDDGMVQFVWMGDFSMTDTLPNDARPMLRVEVPEKSVAFDVPITAQTVAGPEGEFTEIEGTDFAYRIHSVQDNLMLPGRDRTVSIAMVAIRTPEGEFTRMVADQPDMTRDMVGADGDPHAGGMRTPQESDPRIAMTYRPRSAPIVFAAYPEGVFLVVNGPEGRMLGRDVQLGETVEIVPGLSVRADAVWLRAVSEVKPFVVPVASRQRDAGEMFSMIRIELDTGGERQTRWLPFNQYALPNRHYAYAGRFTYAPEHFHLSDGRELEIVFSRERRELPNPIALDDFTLDTHIGGYTGRVHTIRNYVSKLKFLENGHWSGARPIKVNAPTEFGGYWYFQSMWDKPPSNEPTGGMNYTGLGVGNRNGVYIQLAGCCLSVAGMIFAFYVKPVIQRRRRERSMAKVNRSDNGKPSAPQVLVVNEPIGAES